MIIGTEAIGVLNISADDGIVYGARNYTDSSAGGIKISSVGPGILNLTAPSTLNITISGTGLAGRLYTQTSSASLLIGGVGDLGFIYGIVSNALLTISGTTSQTSIQSDVLQPATLVFSTQSLMSWYTRQGQFFDINTAKLVVSGISVDFYLPASTFGGGGGPTEIPQIWIG